MVIVCFTISSMLTMIVIMGRFFSSPVRFEDMLKYKATTSNGRYLYFVFFLRRKWKGIVVCSENTNCYQS